MYLAAPLSLPWSGDLQVETDACVAISRLCPPVTSLHNNEMSSISPIRKQDINMLIAEEEVIFFSIVKLELCDFLERK